jgi:hypothetical protein
VAEVEELVVIVLDTDNPEVVVHTGASDIVVVAAAELYKEHIGLASPIGDEPQRWYSLPSSSQSY